MGFEIPALIGGLIVGALLVYGVLTQRTKQQARTMYGQWIATEKIRIENEADQRAENKYSQISKAERQAWEATEGQQIEQRARRQATDAQRVSLKGKIGEQMAPLFPQFIDRYSPADARFLGSPIDYIIFKNLSKVDSPEEAPLEVVLLDVKTGKSTLTKAQQMIQNAVSGRRVGFDTLRLPEPPMPTQTESPNPLEVPRKSETSHES